MMMYDEGIFFVAQACAQSRFGTLLLGEKKCDTTPRFTFIVI